MVLYCIVLYCIVLYCIVLYCIVLYCIVLYCTVLYCIVPFGPHFICFMKKTIGLLSEQHQQIYKITQEARAARVMESLASGDEEYLSGGRLPNR